MAALKDLLQKQDHRVLTNLEKRICNELQQKVPLVTRPYAEMGTLFTLSEEEMLDKVRSLKGETGEEQVIRQIGAIFDTRSLGYKSSLVAVKVPDERADAAARIINQHPGVSHNYLRTHAYNIWFTIAVPPGSSLEKTVETIGKLVEADPIRLMPTLHLFKIGVKLNMTGEDAADATSEPAYSTKDREKPKRELTPERIQVIRELQEDLPVGAEPFKEMADRLQMTQEQLFDEANAFIAEGMMRRYSAVMNHRSAGFVANAMGVWAVPTDQIMEIGAKMGTFNAVSHAYQRPTYPDWPYNVFTMIHGRSMEDCDQVIHAIEEGTGVHRYELLYSTKEYKKVRLKYFVPALDKWEDKYLRA